MTIGGVGVGVGVAAGVGVGVGVAVGKGVGVGDGVAVGVGVGIGAGVGVGVGALQSLKGELLFCGFGEAIAKSVALSLVSIQPFPVRKSAVVLLGAGA